MEPINCTFEGISVDRRRLTVARGGQLVDLEPKALDVLLYLIDHRDRLVTKEELLDAVWKDTFVTPNVLTRAVALIRKGLGDDADEPRIIETVAKRGYRFIAAVQTEPGPLEERVAPQDTPVVVAAPAGREGSERSTSTRARTPRWTMAAVLALFAAVATIVLAVMVFNRPRNVTAAPSLAAFRRLTTRAGYNGQPAVSADGRSVAYVSDRTGSLEIYVTGLVATGTETTLTSNGGQNIEPDWSPDGHWIAFHSRKLGGIWVVPSNGGQPQQIAPKGASPSWAPDSERLVFTSDNGGFSEQAILMTVRRDGSDLKPLTRIGQSPGGALAPSWSHNGKFIAFANGFGGGAIAPGLFILTVETGQIRQVLSAQYQGRPQFGPDDDVLYWQGWSNPVSPSLRRARLDPVTGEFIGEAETVLPIDGLGDGVSISGNGIVALGQAQDDDNLWSIEMSPAGAAAEPRRITNETVRNNRPSISATGRVAFTRLSPGNPATIWVMDPDGTHAEALLPGVQGMAPSWSRDGSRLFVMQRDRAVWVEMGTRRVTEVPLSVGKIQPAFPRLAPDDSSIAYHRIETDGRMSVWIAPLDGGPERRVAADPQGIGFPIWSSDGKMLAVEMRRDDQTHFGIVPSDGSGPIREIVSDRGHSWPNGWSPDSRRIVYAGEREGVWNIWEVDVATRVSRPLTRFTLPIGYVRYPVWSPDGRRVVFERAIRSGSVWTMSLK